MKPADYSVTPTSRDQRAVGGLGLPYRLRWSENLAPALRERLVKLAYNGQSLMVSGAIVLGAALLFAVDWAYRPRPWVIAWVLSIFAVSVGTAIVAMVRGSTSERDIRPDGWARLIMALALLGGIMWGVGGWVFFTPERWETAYLYLIMLGGLSGLSLVSLQALFGALCAFLIPANGLFVVRLLADGTPQAMALALVLIVLCILLMILARRNQRELLTTVMVAEQNTDLLARLSRREEHFRNLIDNVSDLIAVVDRQGLISFHSPSAERLLGVGRQGLVGRNISDLTHPDDLTLLMGDVKTLLRDPQQVTSRDVRMRHVGGDWRTLHIHGRAMPTPGLEQSVVFSAQDATEQLKVRETLRLAKEHAEAIGRAKTDFLAVMSHEIRTPMSGIIGLIDLLKATGLTEKQREYIGALDRAGEHLSDLLNDILDFSKIEANKLDSEKVVFDLRKTIGGIMDIFRVRAEEKGVRLKARIADNLPRLWTGDVRHMRQVLANLLGNAVKFTESGYVEIRIDRDGTATDGRTLLKIAVEDTGIGIAADKLTHVFEPFAQADASPSRRHGGTGLGLAISRRLVELMQGRIWAISRLNRGSTFFVLLPLEEGSVPTTVGRVIPDDVRSVDTTYFAESRVLVVDDSDLNRLVIGDMLQGLGLRVDMATNGAEAVERFDQDSYALVFLDIQMPVMDGFAAAEAMRECEEYQRRDRCPIIALSATALKDDRDRALEAGCDDYLVKPMRKEALVALLKTYLPVAEDQHPRTARATFQKQDSGAMLEPELLPLLPSFFSHLDEELLQLRKAVVDGEPSVVERVAHQSKGNAMLFGFQDLVEVLRGMEFAARAQREGDGLRDEASLEDWLSHVQVEADAIRKVFPSSV